MGRPIGCTGAYIETPKGVSGAWILTAAHCIYGFPDENNIIHDFDGEYKNKESDFQIDFGVTSEQNHIVRCNGILKQIPNENWIKNEDDKEVNDYGLIQLTETCSNNLHNAGIKPLKLALFTRINGKELIRAGFKKAGWQLLTFQQTVIIPTHYFVTGYNSQLDHLLMTAGEGDKGDSGGPVYDKDEPHNIFGIYSGDNTLRTNEYTKQTVGQSVPITNSVYLWISNQMSHSELAEGGAHFVDDDYYEYDDDDYEYYYDLLNYI